MTNVPDHKVDHAILNTKSQPKASDRLTPTLQVFYRNYTVNVSFGKVSVVKSAFASRYNAAANVTFQLSFNFKSNKTEAE